jgi:hypothetical protein
LILSLNFLFYFAIIPLLRKRGAEGSVSQTHCLMSQLYL